MHIRERETPSPYRRLGALYVVMLCFVVSVNAVSAVAPALPDRFGWLAERFSTEIASSPTLMVPVVVGLAAFMVVVLFLFVPLLGSLILARMLAIVFRTDLRTFRLAAAALIAARRCGAAFGTSGPERTQGLQELAFAMGDVRAALKRCHRDRRTLPRRGGRRKEARAHARRVEQCLNDAERQIDVKGDQALPLLVVYLTQIADQYADGRVGALLDEDSLRDYQAGRDWEALRLAGLAVVVAIGATATGFLALSEPATLVLIISVAVLGVALLYRKNLSRGIGFLELWRP